MTFSVRMSARGLEGVEDRLADLAGRAENLGPLWDDLYQAFLQAERVRFDTQGGGRWAPDVPETTRRKLEKGQDPRTLRGTGSLFRSLTSAGAPDAVFEKTKDSVTFGTSAEHAKYAQGGEGREERMVVVVSERMKQATTESIANWIVRG